MAEQDKAGRNRSLGTGPGVFGSNDEAVMVPLTNQGVEFIFDSALTAEKVVKRLRRTLQSDEIVAKALREEFCFEHLLDFLEKYLPREQIIAVRWDMPLRITISGLECRIPDGEWIPVHIEDIEQGTRKWTSDYVPLDDALSDLRQRAEHCSEMSRSASYACTRFGLSRDRDWESHGKVFRTDGMRFFFSED